jgi:hypothetical protein
MHVWGSPAYLLDKKLADGKKLPRWSPRSQRRVYVGVSRKHASTVPVVLNPKTQTITYPFHVVVDEWFSTVTSDLADLPDFNSQEWMKMFGESTYQYICGDDYTVPDDDDTFALENHESVASAMDDASPPTPLPLPATPVLPPATNVVPAAISPPVSSDWREGSDRRESNWREFDRRESNWRESPSTEHPAQREKPAEAPSSSRFHAESDPSTEMSMSPGAPKQDSASGSVPMSVRDPTPSPSPDASVRPSVRPSDSTRPTHTPRSRAPRGAPDPVDIVEGPRQRRRTDHLTSSKLGTYGLTAVQAPFSAMYYICGLVLPSVFKATPSDPDTLTYQQAMADTENRSKCIEAAEKDVSSFETMGSC